MKNIDLKLQDLIKVELEKLKKKRPFVRDVEVSYEHKENGEFLSKVTAWTERKTVNLTQKNRCAESAIRKLFNNLRRVLGKRPYVRPKRLNFNLREAA